MKTLSLVMLSVAALSLGGCLGTPTARSTADASAGRTLWVPTTLTGSGGSSASTLILGVQ